MPRAAEATPEQVAQPIRKVRPVRSTRQFTEAAEQPTGQEKTRAMRSRGPARQALDEPRAVEVVDHPLSRGKLEMLKFNEDVLTILVHDSTNPTDEPLVEVWNDGVPQRFWRGIEQNVKRKYVEILARCKKTTRGNEKYKDGNGDDSYRYPAHSALRYPFSVIHDPSPRGRDWLKALIAGE